MSSALEEFRAQREAVEQVHARLVEVAALVGTVQSQIGAIGGDRAFRDVLRDEARWLERAERSIIEVRRLREQELTRFWPGVWRRWAVAVVLSVVTVASFGAVYAWASRPSDVELASLRHRVELLDFMAQRVLIMTPTERRQFDALMKGSAKQK